jgi:mycoredoxin
MELTSAELPSIFTTSWCGYCVRLKSHLSRAGIDYHEIDIESHPEGAAVVAEINGGNLTVPTVVLPNGSTLTNPSVRQVSNQLTSPAT